ncbi:MAG: hypothetical protein RBU23_04115 [Candidatus Auribacterota bacterium]|jgi:hypothetical protein|nr:hypothetical protein [Candidatus Auribacterota bacterium]
MDKVKLFFRNHWPLLAGVGVLYGLVLWCLLSLLRLNDGHFVYTLDDPYIHMAMAKNVVRHGVWGITGHYFTSSSSSLIWTALISICYFVFGVNDYTPLILNILIATGLLIWLYAISKNIAQKQWMTAVLLISVTVLTSLPNLIFMGMEHTLHLMMTILFAYFASADLSCSGDSTRNARIRLLILAPLLILSRFEGLFMVFAVCCLYLARKRIIQAVTTGVSALLPIVIFGLISVSKGWLFLPNSVMLKGKHPAGFSFTAVMTFLNEAIDKAVMNPFLMRALACAVILAVFFIIRTRKFWIRQTLLAVIFCCTMILHLLFAQIGWFFRYEAYLVGFGIFVSGFLLMPDNNSSETKRLLKSGGMTAVLFIILVVVTPFDARSVHSTTRIPIASNNIYDQQYQMARFIKQFYNRQTVAFNDIGAVNYYADIRCLDLWGLASMETARLRMSRKYYVKNIEDIAKKYRVKIAILYDAWFPNLPESWLKAGEWIIFDNQVCGHNVVSFYAIDPDEHVRLSQTLKHFSPSLPSDVRYRFFDNP